MQLKIYKLKTTCLLILESFEIIIRITKESINILLIKMNANDSRSNISICGYHKHNIAMKETFIQSFY